MTRLNLAGAPVLLIVIILLGYLADKVKPMYTIASAFIVRGVALYSFEYISDPNSFFSYAVVIFFVAGATGQVVSMESFFMKNLPGNVRGAMTMILMFILSSWAMAFNALAGILFD